MNKKMATAILITLMAITTYLTFKSLDKLEIDIFEFEDDDDQDADL